MRLTAWFGLAAVAAALASAALASWLLERSPAPAPPPAKHDADGDPLPPWAVCRVGSARFRCAGAFVAFTEGGARIVHGTTDGFVRVIERRTGEVVHEFAAQNGEAGRGPARSRLHEIERAFRTRPWRDTIVTAAVSPDGTLVVTRGYRTTNVYELATGRSVARWRHENVYGPLAWSPDGRRVVATDFQAGLDVRDAATGMSVLSSPDPRPVARGFGGEICAAVSPDGSLAAVQTCKLRVVDLATGEERFATEPGDFAGPVAFSPDGAFLLHMRKDQAVVVRDTKTWTAVREFAGNATALAASPDGRLVAVAGDRLRVLEFATGTPRAEFPVAASRVAFSLDGSALAALVGVTVRVFDVARGVEDPPPVPPLAMTTGLAWSPDGRRLAVADDNVLRVADATTGRIERSWEVGGQHLLLEPFADDGRHVGVLGPNEDKNGFWVALLDTTSDAPPERHRAPTPFPYWDPGAKALHAIVFDGRKPRIVEASSGALVREMPGTTWDGRFHLDPVERLAAVDTAAERELDVYDLTTGALLSEIVAPAALVDVGDGQVADGRVVLRDDGRGVIAVFDARTGARRVLIEAKAELDGPAAVSRDGSLVASFDRDHAVRVFDGTVGRELAILHGHRGGLRGIAFSPDGRRLATASEDGTILVWDVAPASGR